MNTYLNIDPLDQDDFCHKCYDETPAIAVIHGGECCYYCANKIPLCEKHLKILIDEINSLLAND